MVLKPEPLFRAVEYIYASRTGSTRRIILLSPQGRRFDQSLAYELSQCPQITLICGRYEGVDERVVEYLATDEVSIGDYVLTGGELAACVVLDAVTRLIPGVLHNESSVQRESFGPVLGLRRSPQETRLLDCPHYTRPEVFGEMRVPEVLLSGNHAKIQTWRCRKALEKTLKNRPDLLKYEGLSTSERALLEIEREL